MKLRGQARCVLNTFLDEWDHAYADNLEDDVTREASRDVWGAFYKRKGIFDLCQIQVGAGGKAPIRPDVLSRSRPS